ncbi:MAG TPA: hypothetical protein VK586_05470, partial [Streptosporangiaceae bacterium]|nr:hypothetical protein [Streptosporangiaceae bacterium]
APAAERPSAPPARSQPAPPPPAPAPPAPAPPAAAPTAPAPQPAAAAASGGQVDTAQLVDRWPDILEAVRNERKVAWMVLAGATVQSLADNALTIGFPGEGNARGFVSSGHDAVLSQVLRQMFGISPQIKAIARTPETARPPADRGGGGVASPPPGRSAPARPAANGPSAPGSTTSRNDAAPWDGPSDDWDDPRDDEDEYADTASVPAVPPPVTAPAPGARPGPAGPGGGALTGMDLIERELGGRVIEDPGLA